VTCHERRSALDRAAALAQLGRVEDAAAIYRELVGQEPDDVHALCGLSRCMGKLGRAAAGLEIAERATALAPVNDWPHRLRSAHLLLLGRPGAALDAARTARTLDPRGFASLLSVFEAEVALRSGRSAMETARLMVRTHPGEPEAHNGAGRAAMMARDWGRAESAFREALRLAPHEPVYQANLGIALERRGRGREAMQHFRRAVSADPGNPVVRRQLVHAIDRRQALTGVGVGLVGGLGVSAVLNATELIAWAVAAAAGAVVLASVLALRWWRLRQLDETLRTFYRYERRRWRALRQHVLACVCGIGLASVALIATVGWLSRSWPAAAVSAALVLLALRFPGLHVWRREVVPKLHARHGVLR